ncbi:hypothetical protein RZO55_05440 [Clostridium boliviensis]|uniref:Diaminopimelate dehydrogenase n=1 Tax=Clostridium boliviensis TaxID=318465 RepID=A0ABU4GL89_9CLOT|nr:hypothetical protein [Clostridium boliviensis]MDW2797022.1 hypothetical protein [Clostridium boliviensis]
MTIKIGILGYGNLGKGVECAIRRNHAYARAAYRFNKEGMNGCKTVFDIPPSYLSILSSEDLTAAIDIKRRI